MSGLLDVVGASAIAVLTVLAAGKAKTAGQAALVIAAGTVAMVAWVSLFYGAFGFADLAEWLGDVLLGEETR